MIKLIGTASFIGVIAKLVEEVLNYGLLTESLTEGSENYGLITQSVTSTNNFGLITEET